MDIFLYIIIFAIGTLFGSFFTLAVHRLPLKQDITHERSYCPNCNHALGFFDMIPILSYIFLRGKCRYCKQKIRPRYLILEILSGLVFVLFAASVRLSIFELQLSKVVYFVFATIYLAVLFIIAGIDKEKRQIQKGVLLFGYIVEALYIIYLYIVEKDPNIYRYVIYLSFLVVLALANTFYLRKKVKNSYVIDILLLCMFFLIFTAEAVTILTINFTLIIVAIQMLINNIRHKKQTGNIPFGFYLCTTNIIIFILANFYIFI